MNEEIHQNHLNRIYALIAKELRVELVSGFDLSVLINDQKVIERYLGMIYSIGFNDGAKNANKSHANGMEKRVKQIDRFGNVVEIHESLSDASRKVKASGRGAISYAIKKSQRCKGFRFEFA